MSQMEPPAERVIPELKGAQQAIRTAFFADESGLFVLNCNPGAGKSTVANQIAAEALLRHYRSGEPAPERHLCVTSFARDDAATLEPGVEAALRAFANRDDLPVEVNPPESQNLARRLRRSDMLGTIDSVLRSVFADIAPRVGFDEMPTIGNDALLATLHENCIDELRDDPTHADRLRRLDTAYPGGEYANGLDELLPAALDAIRERRLSIEAFEKRLRETIKAAYPDGPPADFPAVLRDIKRFVDTETAKKTEIAFDDPDRDAFVAADQDCYDAWTEAVSDFCILLRHFQKHYDVLTRERGVATHLDAAHWVAEYFMNDEYESDSRDHCRETIAAHFDTLVVDEAQDMSVVQHDALAPFIDADTRVLLVGDSKQCIYAWRNARPSLFQRAFDEGIYFGIDWDIHETARAARTYRSRPDVAAAVDTIFDDIFQDPARGDAGSLSIDYPHLIPDRAPIDSPNIHIAAYSSSATPGLKEWIDDEASLLANYLAGALDSGTLDTPDTPAGEFPSITVLFARRTYMDTFAQALEKKGLSVADASQHLFDHPLVRVVVAIIRWLVNPFDPEWTKDVLDADIFPDELTETVATYDWSVKTAARADVDCSNGVTTVLSGLADLASQYVRHASNPGAVVVENVINRLSLAADPLDLTDHEEDAHRRVATLDALLDHITEWEGDGHYPIADLAMILARYTRNPSTGPNVPVPNTEDHDIVFQTIYQMKGDEDEVVVLADLSADLGFHGPYDDVFVARGSHLALAPPADNDADPPALDSFDHGVYAHPERTDEGPEGGNRRDAGLRWASERWVTDSKGNPHLAGPPPLRDAAGDHRAERWRLLYVAATRTRDHLVVPLPHSREPERRLPRTYWMDALADRFELERAPTRGTYEVDAPPRDDGDRSFTVTVNDVPLVDRLGSTENGPVPFVATTQSASATGWIPRYANASTLYPLATDLEAHILAHVQGNALHTERESPPDSLPLTFETYGPDAVGNIAHAVLMTAVNRRVSTRTLQGCTGPLADRLDAALDEEAKSASETERERLRTFVADTICPQFAHSNTWARLCDSASIYVDEPLDGVVRVNGVNIESQNIADIVSIDSTGNWHVDDLKISLAAGDAEMRKRYALQVAIYAWLLEQQLDESPTATVTRLGVDPGTRTVTAPVLSVKEWFGELSYP